MKSLIFILLSIFTLIIFGNPSNVYAQTFTDEDVSNAVKKLWETNKTLKPLWEVDCDDSPEGKCIDVTKYGYNDSAVPSPDNTLPEATYYQVTNTTNGFTVNTLIESNTKRDPAKYNIVIMPLGYSESEIPNLLMSIVEEIKTIPPLFYRWDQVEIVGIQFPQIKECGSVSTNLDKAACQIFAQQLYREKFRYYDDLIIYYFKPDIVAIKYGCKATGMGTGSIITSSLLCIPHEFGHVMGLLDEYVYGDEMIEDLLRKKVYSTTYEHVDGYPNFSNENCLWGHPPYNYWEGFIGKWDYYLGCTYKNQYRTFNSGLMNLAVQGNYSPMYIKYYNSSLTNVIGYPKKTISTPTLTLPKDSKYIWLSSGEVQFNLDDVKNTAYVEVWINGKLATSEVTLIDNGGKVYLDLRTPYLYPNTEIEFKPFNYFGQQGKSDGLIANPIGEIKISSTGQFQAQLDTSSLNLELRSPTYIWSCDTKKDANPELKKNNNYGTSNISCKYSAPGEYFTALKITSIVKDSSGTDSLYEFILKNKITVLEDGSIKSE